MSRQQYWAPEYFAYLRASSQSELIWINAGALLLERQAKKMKGKLYAGGRVHERKGRGERADSGAEPPLSMINSRRISVVLRAYNAGAALLRPMAEVDRKFTDYIVLADAASRDLTVPVAGQIEHAATLEAPGACRN